MKCKIINSLFGLILIVAVVSIQLQAMRLEDDTSVSTFSFRSNLLDSIVKHAENVVKAKDKTTRQHAQKKLSMLVDILLNNKQVDPNIKGEIVYYAEMILKSTYYDELAAGKSYYRIRHIILKEINMQEEVDKSITKLVEDSLEINLKEISLLDRIIQQAKSVIKFKNYDSVKRAQKELGVLVNSKELDQKIKNIIAADVAILYGPYYGVERYKACYRLLDNISAIKEQANVIGKAEEITQQGSNASVGKTQEVIDFTVKKFQHATNVINAVVSDAYARAKKMVTSSIDYLLHLKNKAVPRY